MQGIKVYVDPGLLLAGPALGLHLGGFWKLRWLKVSGVAPLAASCAM